MRKTSPAFPHRLDAIGRGHLRTTYRKGNGFAQPNGLNFLQSPLKPPDALLTGMRYSLSMVPQLSCAYVLPIRRTCFNPGDATSLRRYVDTLKEAGCEVIVANGSAPEVFDQYAAVLGASCRHVRVDRRFGYVNDKVNGIYTGIELASPNRIIVADDDIRYSPGNIRTIIGLLDDNDVVRPQNFLDPLPWWAKMEAARMLINRALLPAADYPGTCAFRRERMLASGRYDGDVLFDNEEIIRHLAHDGCRIAYANDLFVRKCPPTFRKWTEQRPRQAYEDFGMCLKTTLFFVLLPLFVFFAARFGVAGFAIFFVAVSFFATLIAGRGRGRGKARQFFPMHCCLFAGLWMLERTLSTYLALYWYVTRGGYPFGGSILSRGIGRAWWSGGRAAAAQVRLSTKS
jgi:glycosyl transferase family 2